MKMSDKVHDILRTMQWLIPAIVALYGTIGDYEICVDDKVQFLGIKN